MVDAAVLLTNGRLRQAVIDRLIKGEDRSSILLGLRARLDEQQSSELLEGAEREIENLKSTGAYEAEERRVLFRKRRVKYPTLQIFGWFLVVSGSLSALSAILLSLSGSAAAMSPIGLILGTTILLLNRTK